MYRSLDQAIRILELLGRRYKNPEDLEDALLRLGVDPDEARIPRLNASVRQWEVEIYGFKPVVEKKSIPKKRPDGKERDPKYGYEEVDHVTNKVERPSSWTEEKATVT